MRRCRGSDLIGPPAIWRLIEDPPLDGYRNMAVDEALLESCASRAAGFPCLRLYSFHPACLSLGFSQPAEGAVDPSWCRSHGIDIARRPTGGRAVLHDAEVTYAVVGRYGEPPFPATVLDSYCVISRGLIAGFASLGLRAAVTAGEKPAGPGAGGAVCFAEPTRHEIASGEFKIAGSAQARRRGAFLQHGSIPIVVNMENLARATGSVGGEAAPPGAAPGTVGCAGLPEIRGVAQILGRDLSESGLRAALVDGFEKEFGVRLVPGALAGTERESAERLRADRYLSAAWTYRR